MGTSKSAATPSGGGWTPVKTDVTSALAGNSVSPGKLVAGTISAFGGLSPSSSGSGETGGGGSAAGSGSGVGGGSRRTGVANAVSGLSGFGSGVASGGLNQALQNLGVSDLVGKSAAEVIGKVAERLSEASTGQEKELLSAALRDALLDAAGSQLDGSYESLDSSLESFIQAEGVEGLVELFIGNYAFELVWYGLEQHVTAKSGTNEEAEALASAVRSACQVRARDAVSAEKTAGKFAQVDWFGSEGQKRGFAIAEQLERQLTRGDDQ